MRTGLFSPGTKVAREECTTHHWFFPAGITVIEYLTNLHEIGVERCRFWCAIGWRGNPTGGGYHGGVVIERGIRARARRRHRSEPAMSVRWR